VTAGRAQLVSAAAKNGADVTVTKQIELAPFLAARLALLPGHDAAASC